MTVLLEGVRRNRTEASPQCAQCRISMRLDRVVPDRSELFAFRMFRCPDCGLADSVCVGWPDGVRDERRPPDPEPV